MELVITPALFKESYKNGKVSLVSTTDVEECTSPYFKIWEGGAGRFILARIYPPENGLVLRINVREDVFIPEGRTKLKVLVRDMRDNPIPLPPGYTADLIEVLDDEWI